MGDIFKGIGAWFAALALLLVTGAIVDYSGLVWDSHIGVKKANVQRQIFEQSKSYREGKAQELIRYHHEYVTSDALGKKAVAATVRQAFADFDTQDLSPEMRDFLNECKMQ